MNPIDPHIFRAYDIRGRAGEQLTENACQLIGYAFANELCERYNLEHPQVAVGRDARVHGVGFETAVIAGLTTGGCHVVRIGQTPSPMNYFTVCDRHLDGSIQVTASHNPAHDNGLKLQVRNAEAFAGDDLQRLRQNIEKGEFISGSGKTEEIDAVAPYLDFIASLFAGIGNGLHVVVDSGNGVAGPSYCEALRRVGCTVTELYTEPDGTFPNHPADPSKHETLKDLQELVVSKKANLGLAFDGDGDRVGLVDEAGVIRTADEILLLLAQDYLSRHPGSPVVFTVSNSSTLQSEIERWGGKPVMCKVGHSFVEHAMIEHGAKLGGEQSGHFFCGEEYFGFDDALVASMRLLKIMATAGKPVSALCSAFPKVYQAPELRPACPDDQKAGVIQKVIAHFQKDYAVETMDGARINFGDGAWAGIRMSNTSPCLSVCIEARSAEKLLDIEKIVLGHLRTYDAVKL